MKTVAALVMACLCLLPFAATAGDAAINQVVVRVGAANDASRGVNSVQGRYLPKFFDTVQGSVATVDVAWTAPDGGLPDGGKMVLEYRLREGGATSALASIVQSGARGRQSTTFSIPRVGDTGSANLVAWRVSLLAGGQTLAQKKSDSWK